MRAANTCRHLETLLALRATITHVATDTLALTEDRKIAHILIAPDKFRATASAHEVAAAATRAAQRFGHTVETMPLADGGEGLLDVIGGNVEHSEVHDPLGNLVIAEWRFLDEASGHLVPTAVLEMAKASGLALVGGAAANDPMAASTRGTGELIRAALDRGARRIIIGLGGSATTDGGLGAVDAVADDPRLGEIELLAACDVTTAFMDAASVFGPQKGASAVDVITLTRRLQEVAAQYLERFSIDVTALAGAGAAGGLGGGLAALGATLQSGFALVADLLGLDEAIDRADLVVTGEGSLDSTSFAGKVVGGVVESTGDRAALCCVVGTATEDSIARVPQMTVLSLVDRYGLERAMHETVPLIEELLASYLHDWTTRDEPTVHPVLGRHATLSPGPRPVGPRPD